MTMTRTEDLTRIGYCKVCSQSFKPGGHYDRERLLSVGICETCDFWMDCFRTRNNPSTAIVNGNHYVIGELEDKPKGLGGARIKVNFFDGREIITDSLWSQGEIPADWVPYLYDNATMEIIR